MRWAGITVAVIAATVDILYLGYVNAQVGSDPQFLRVPFVASFIALMAICGALSTRESAARWRSFLLGIAAGGLLLLGFFALFSIGLPLMVAGLVALLGVIGSLPGVGHALEPLAKARRIAMPMGGAAASVVVLLAGFSLTEVAIRCPATGSEGGGGISVLGFSYQYSCDNGKLTITR